MVHLVGSHYTDMSRCSTNKKINLLFAVSVLPDKYFNSPPLANSFLESGHKNPGC